MPEQRKKAEVAMLRRMEDGPFPFAYRDIYRAGNLAVGDTEMLAGGVAYRWADALIQRERKAGRIVQVKRGQWVRADAKETRDA